MSHNDTPYPFDGMPEDDYFGEFSKLSNSIGHYEENHKDPTHHDNTDNKKFEDTFTNFTIFPMD